MLKIIKNSTLVPTPIVDLKLDSEPRQGSTDPVTSDGVKSAIDGAVGDAAAALQEQIDEIAEKAGSGYIPKGEATVATLNALSGQENGELYTMTDAGTLTDGSLAVVAGDTVAWDATNEVWYKAMDYAPSQYGTNEVHNLPTTITAFRTGDVIPVDGPDGTAKMTKDDLLKETAENALGSIHSLSDAATEDDLVAGNYLAIDGSTGTKKLRAQDIAKRSLQNAIAPVFSGSAAYGLRSLVTYYCKLYRFISTKSPGPWDSTKVEEVSLNDAVYTWLNMLALEFDSNNSYKRFDVVKRCGLLYMFNKDHTGAWSSDVTQIDLASNVLIVPINENKSTYSTIRSSLSLPIGTKFFNCGIRVALGDDADFTNRKDLESGETWSSTFEVNIIKTLSVAGRSVVYYGSPIAELAYRLSVAETEIKEINAFKDEMILVEDISLNDYSTTREIEGYGQVSNSLYLQARAGTNTFVYKCTEGDIVEIKGTNNAPSPFVTITAKDTDAYVSGDSYEVLSSVKGKFTKYIKVPTYNFIEVTFDAGTSLSVKKVSSSAEFAKFQKENYAKDGVVKSETFDLEANEDYTLDDFPYCNKKGDVFNFRCDIDGVFAGLKLCKGYKTYRSAFLYITDTEVILYRNDGTSAVEGSVVERVSHGLTISTMLYVNVRIDDDAKARVEIITSSGGFSAVLDKWTHDVNGVLRVISLGTIKNCILSATNPDFKNNVWLFGDSYFGVTNERWIGQLKNAGYWKVLVNGLAGRASPAAYNDLVKSLACGSPRYVMWAILGNDYGNLMQFTTYFNKVIALSHKYKFIPIFITMPNLPPRDGGYVGMDAVVTGSGYRYVDIAYAVDPNGASAGSTWYNGMLGSDELHPTEIGALVILGKVFENFPEITECVSASGTAGQDGGGDL